MPYVPISISKLLFYHTFSVNSSKNQERSREAGGRGLATPPHGLYRAPYFNSTIFRVCEKFVAVNL